MLNLSNWYDEYVSRINETGSTPTDYYKNYLQQLSNERFKITSTLATIQEEQHFGKLDWSDDLQVRITHIISDKNTGEKLGDDFRNVIFPSINYECVLGQRYSFDNNYWIIVNTDKYKYPTISACIRRANNVLNNYDSNKVLHTEPCIIDNKIRSTDFDFNSNIIVPDGYCTILVQGNDWTKTYYLNQRFMYGGQAWKCTFINNFQRVNTLDASSVNLIRMILMKDALAPDDDKENNIPNTQTYNYTISIDQGSTLEQEVNYSSTLSCTIKKNNVVINDIDVVWSSSDEDIVSISPSNGNFIGFSLLKSGSAVVSVSMKNNPSISCNYFIAVTSSPSGIVDFIIDPQSTVLYQADETTYTVKKTIDNEDSSETLTIQDITTGIPSGYYTFTSGTNTFKIKNLKMYSANNVKIIVSDSDGNSKEFDFQLMGW